MKSCPSCGADLTAAKKLVRTSARDLVESLQPHDVSEDFVRLAPEWDGVRFLDEIEQFKDRMRANGYRTNAGPVRDAHAAFRTHLRNAVKFAQKRSAPSVKSVPRAAERKDL